MVASEVMAILCLATSLEDLKERLGNIVVGYTRDERPVAARDLGAHGAMAVLLKDAIKPNLVQTLEGNPAFVHGGPFANIAHGCNSVMATKTALKLADYVLTEAGFGADLGAEKFVDIKCRMSGLRPSMVVLVATIRALKFHGGAELGELEKEDLGALEGGLANLERHINNVRNHFGLPCVVAINRFPSDTEAEISLLEDGVAHQGARVVLTNHWAEGGVGAEALAHAVVETVQRVPAQVQVRLRRGRQPLGQDLRRGDQDLRRQRGGGGHEGAAPDPQVSGRRVRSLPGVHCQDTVLVFDGPLAAGRPVRPRTLDPRGAALGRCGVRRRRVRGHNDHARVAQVAGLGAHRPRQEGGSDRAVLKQLAMRSNLIASSQPVSKSAFQLFLC